MTINKYFKSLNIEKPDQIFIFSPHPDDISIAMGGFVILASRVNIPIHIYLMSDGSEAVIPESFLLKNMYGLHKDACHPKQLRGHIRVREAEEEARRLGLPEGAVTLLTKQSWFDDHQTPSDALNDDGSLRDVNRFKAGPVSPESIEEIHDIIRSARGNNVFCAVPSPFDQQLMHNLTTALVIKALSMCNASYVEHLNLLLYKCLSTQKWQVSESSFVLGFGNEIMELKCHAINANQSMKARREIIGGYANKGNLFYDTIVREENAASACEYKMKDAYAECFRLCSVNTKEEWHLLKAWADKEISFHKK
jgi:LmbE family N-acetylglucosaminyl deacetylase